MDQQKPTNEIDIASISSGLHASHLERVDVPRLPFPSVDFDREKSLFNERSIPHDFIASVWRTPYYCHIMRRTNGQRLLASYVAHSAASATKPIGEWTKEGDECSIEYCEYDAGDDGLFMPAACRALWLNLSHAVEGYDNEWAAWDALGGFCDATQLPRPQHVIDMGDCLQAVWVADSPLLADEWCFVSNELWSLAESHGLMLKADSRSLDARHLLPGTVNRGMKMPRPVVMLHSDTVTEHSWPNMRSAIRAAKEAHALLEGCNTF